MKRLTSENRKILRKETLEFAVVLLVGYCGFLMCATGIIMAIRIASQIV